MLQTPCGLSVSRVDMANNVRIKSYPDGSHDVLACDRSIFHAPGWERAGWKQPLESQAAPVDPMDSEGWMTGDGPSSGSLESLTRSMRRARAKVRDLALCTPFAYFVTLTLAADKVDRYDIAVITRKLTSWCDNQVRRAGLAYVLVPELHKDGAVHFHGFFNAALEAVDSGTLSLPGGGKPRRPRSAAQRSAWLSEGAHVVYNLPAWSLGYTTAIALYGSYSQAVGYVCKYIGKGGAKIGGRWYYSGGQLGHPEVSYCDASVFDLAAAPGAYSFGVPAAGLSFVQIHVEAAHTFLAGCDLTISGLSSAGQLSSISGPLVGYAAEKT